MGSCGPWKCVPFESDLQPAVQREGEGEGEVGIAAATCAQGNGFTPDAVPVVWVRVTVRVSPQRPAAASAPSCSLVALLQLGQEWLWLGVLVVGFESRRFSLYHIPPYQKRCRMGGDRTGETASLTLAVERDATMAVGRPYGDAIDGAVLVGRQRITCDLASLPPRPYHVCTPPPRVRTSKTAADLTQLTVSSRACGRRLVPAAHE